MRKTTKSNSKRPLSGEIRTQNHISGIYTRRINVNIIDIHRHRQLSAYYKQYYFRFKSHLGFSPYINHILESLPDLCFFPSFLLSYTLCRVNELDQITLSKLKQHAPLLIKSSKSAHIRTIEPLFPFKNPQLQALSDQSFIMAISYDHLKQSIKKTKILINTPHVAKILDVTHIFRHLQASHLFSIGVPIDTISYKLGHLFNKTTSHYIHKEFYSNCLKL